MSRKEALPRFRERRELRAQRAAAIVAALREAYPDAHCALTYATPFQLLIATILSAQCTDARVNMVTPSLFDRFPDAMSLAQADEQEVAQIIRSTGFFRQKSHNIVATARTLTEHYDGHVPADLPNLIKLPGVARKTANVVIANCYPEQVEGIAVDTHVQRISRRLALTRSFEPIEIERDLMKILPRSEWGHFTHLLIDHGRAVCKAPLPICDACPIAHLCPSRDRFLSD